MHCFALRDRHVTLACTLLCLGAAGAASPAFNVTSGSGGGVTMSVVVPGAGSVDGLSLFVGGSSPAAMMTLVGGPVRLWDGSRWLSSADGSLARVGAPVVGSRTETGLGTCDTLSQAWSCGARAGAGGGAAAPACLETQVLVSRAHPAVVFRTHFPRGLGPGSALSGAAPWASLNTTAASLSEFPSFRGDAGSMGQQGALGFQTWFSEFAVTPSYRAGVWPAGFRGGWEGGSPLALLPRAGGAAVFMSPLDEFLAGVHALGNASGSGGGGGGSGLVAGPHGLLSALPAGYVHDSVLVADAGFTAAQMRWGSLLLARHGKPRTACDASSAIEGLGYSGDGFYYYDPWTGNTTCGDYESAYEAMHAYASSTEPPLPFHFWMLDSWWYGQAIHDGIWTWDEEAPCIRSRFPRGLPHLHEVLGTPIMAHMGTWLAASPYAARYPGTFVTDALSPYAMPTSQRFWDELIANASTRWGMAIIKQDHMDQQVGCNYNHGSPQCHAWPGITDVALAPQLLAQQSAAAQRAGVTIQYGTALPNQVANSVKLAAVTHVRGANDYVPAHAVDAWRIGPAAALFWSVGLLTSKDTFFSSTAETPAKGEFAGYHEPYPALHLVVSALSAGPVSPSDGVNGSDVGLIMRACRLDGVLLKPDAPALPLDAWWNDVVFGAGGAGGGGRAGGGASGGASGGGGPDGDVWVTRTQLQLGNVAHARRRTAAPGSMAAPPLTWHYAFASLAADYNVTLQQLQAHAAAVPALELGARVSRAARLARKRVAASARRAALRGSGPRASPASPAAADAAAGAAEAAAGAGAADSDMWVMFAPAPFQPASVKVLVASSNHSHGNASDGRGNGDGNGNGNGDADGDGGGGDGSAEGSVALPLRAGATYGDYDYVALAPMLPGLVSGDGRRWALLGEVDKAVPVSRQRIATLALDAASATVGLMGAPGEVVALAFASVAASPPPSSSEARGSRSGGAGGGGGADSAVAVVMRNTTIAGDGTGVIVLSVE